MTLCFLGAQFALAPALPRRRTTRHTASRRSLCPRCQSDSPQSPEARKRAEERRKIHERKAQAAAERAKLRQDRLIARRERRARRGLPEDGVDPEVPAHDEVDEFDEPKVLIAKTTAIGLVAGLAGSLIGAGGGVIMTPLLTSTVGLSQHEAHGTSLVAVGATALAGALSYSRAGAVHLSVAIVLALAALLSSPAGARFSAKVDAKRLKFFFGSYLVLAAFLVPLKGMLVKQSAEAVISNTAAMRFAAIFPLGFLGIVTGFASGLLGVGGGTIMVPALVVAMGIGQKLAQGTALAAMGVSAVTGSFAHWQMGHVQPATLPGLMLGSAFGAAFGGSLAVRLSDVALKIICGLGLSAIGFRYMWSSRSALTRAASEVEH